MKYSCNQCDKTFTLQGHLKRHILTVHEGVKYPCNQCDKTFTQQQHLKMHLVSVHEGVKFACDKCEAKFTLKGNIYLTNHLNKIFMSCTACFIHKESSATKLNMELLGLNRGNFHFQ